MELGYEGEEGMGWEWIMGVCVSRDVSLPPHPFMDRHGDLFVKGLKLHLGYDSRDC